jgi:hypothetical protein
MLFMSQDPIAGNSRGTMPEAKVVILDQPIKSDTLLLGEQANHHMLKLISRKSH